MAKGFSTTPSSLLGLPTGSLAAYNFDSCVAVWGNFVEAELQKVEGKTSKEIERKQQSRLNTLLGNKEAKGQYADPATMFNKG